MGTPRRLPRASLSAGAPEFAAVAGRGAAASGSAAVVSSVAQAGGRPGPWAISRDFMVLLLNRGRRRDVVWPNIFEHCTGNRVRQTHRSLKRQVRARAIAKTFRVGHSCTD